MKSIKNKVFLIILFLCVSPIVKAQNVDKIIAKHINAHGGVKNWEAIKSMKITGKFTAFSVMKDFYAIKTKKGAYYSELHLGKHKVKESFNGKTGWTIDPWQEINYPRALNKTELNVFKQKAEFFTPFYKYKEKGHKVEFLGEKNIDGIDVYVIKLTRPSGKFETWYLNTKTYLEYKYESEWVDFAFSSPAESYFDDFRKINGIIIPFYIERTFRQRNRVTQINNIEFNNKVDESLFKIAKSKEIEKLAFLAGKWDIKCNIWFPGYGWYPVDSTVSEIKFVSTNLLHEEIEYDAILPQSKKTNYTYNSSTKKYRLSVFNRLSSNIEVFEGDFTDSSFTVENTNISYGDTTVNRSFSQIIYSKLEKDSFILEIKNSNDKGKTWNPSDKFIYIRRKE
ncbi:MAG: hypothetical protein ABFS35_07365 [Bacteroidota bacterium]